VHIGEINKKYYIGYEGHDYIAFKIKERKDTALILWDGYIDSMLENQKKWDSGLSLDWCEEAGPYELKDEDVIVDIDSYFDDLNNLDMKLFSERLFTKKELIEAYDSILNFIKYVKENDLTLIVNIGVDY